MRHDFDKRHRPSTVKSEESETWMPLHPEAEAALRHALDQAPDESPETLVFRGPRGGIITSTLINDALTAGCQASGLGYRVTAHGLRHSFANWLKTAGAPTRDIQEALRHRDQRTTATYLHTSDTEKWQSPETVETRISVILRCGRRAARLAGQASWPARGAACRAGRRGSGVRGGP